LSRKLLLLDFLDASPAVAAAEEEEEEEEEEECRAE